MQQALQLPIYLDNNATTAVDPQVLEAMLPYLTLHFGNAASRNHSFGWTAEEAVAIAREQIASLTGASAEEIIFTSGATEAVNLAIKGVYETYSSRGKHIITCITEHKAVLDTCKHLEKSGASVTYLPVDNHGVIDIRLLEQSIQTDTILIAIMFANNETGVLQPVEAIGRIAKEKGILFFSDATQAVGKVPVDVEKTGIDLLCLSAHKIYGPKGAGALYVRRKHPRVRLTAQIDGGGHEKGMRSGTLNVPGIVALGKACALCEQQMDEETSRISILKNKLEAGLTATGNVYTNGGDVLRLPNVANLSFDGIKSNRLLTEISKTIAVSSGSACTSANPEASHVLKAMGIDDTLARNSIRFGLGRFTTEKEIAYTIFTVTQIIADLRK